MNDNIDKFLIITAFSQSGFDQYGRKMIVSFDRLLPGNIRIAVCHEFNEVPFELTSKRFIPINRSIMITELKAFSAKCRLRPTIAGAYNYRFDAEKFAYKSYSMHYMLALFAKTAERIYWMDGDTVAHESLTQEWLMSLLPDNYLSSYLGRTGFHSETGFLGFSPLHPEYYKFIRDFKNHYDSGEIFNLDGFTDCDVYDKCRGMRTPSMFYNLSPGASAASHPFVNSILGERLDHLKGNRKTAGRSRKVDLSVERNGEYWK